MPPDPAQRLVLDAASFLEMRRELVFRVGMEWTRKLFMQWGYARGAQDALLREKNIQEDKQLESLIQGMTSYAATGLGRIEVIKTQVVLRKAKFFAESLLHDSMEAQKDGHPELSHLPLCWVATGYASGYCTTLLGRPVLFRETACRAMGDPLCRITGQNEELWGEEAPALWKNLTPEDFVNRARFDTDLPEDVVGISPAFAASLRLLKKVAPTQATVLLLGESGVGKEVFAKIVHRISPRKDKPFVAVNCAAIPETLMESEFFGVEKGAYTGATFSRPGFFEQANGGTIFLDEVGAMSLAAQAKFLRVLQEREVMRVGKGTPQKINVRVVAATNVDLKKEMAQGRFREDLYFRLTVFPMHIPPLRERLDDVPLLVDYFLKRFCRLHQKRVKGLTERAMRSLLSFDYPGNVRMLEHMMERAVILAEEGGSLDVGHLFVDEPLPAPGKKAVADGLSLDEMARHLLASGVRIEHLEEAMVREALSQAQGNLAKAAKLLGMTRAQVVWRVKKPRASCKSDCG